MDIFKHWPFNLRIETHFEDYRSHSMW